jgi:Na+/melibiose symporter-like transporter
MTANLAAIIGPPLAGPLLFGLGVRWALLVNVLSFVASFLAVLGIRVPHTPAGVVAEQQSSFRQEFGAGLHCFASNRTLRTITIALVVAMLGLGSLSSLSVFFLTQNLHAPAQLYGLLGAAFGVGSIAGAAIAGPFVSRIGLVRAFWLSMVAVGAMTILFARMTGFVPALIVYGLLGMPNAVNNVAFEPLVLRVTPPEFVGRVMSVLVPAYSLAATFSIAIAGYLDSAALHSFYATALGLSFGPVDTIFTGAGVLTIAGGLLALAV